MSGVFSGIAHGGGVALAPDLVKRVGVKFFCLDLKEVSHRQLQRLERRLSETYGSGRTLALVHGSSSGNHILVLSHCRAHDRVVVPRNIHKSVVAAMVLSGVDPVYVQPQFSQRLGVAVSPPAFAYEQVMNREPDIRAVLVTSPTYDGVCQDIQRLVITARQHDAFILVDEAHGPHLQFHPSLPPTALEQGADGTVQSLHKVLAALGQTAVLHLRMGSRVVPIAERMREWLISPDLSPALVLSMEAALTDMCRGGKSAWGAAIERANRIRHAVETLGFECWEKRYAGEVASSYDPCKITVCVDEFGWTGKQAALYLDREWRISAELFGPASFLLMVSASTTEEHVNRLLKAMKALARMPKPRMTITQSVPPKVNKAMRPRDAAFARKAAVRLQTAVGEIAAETIAPYPPGTPILIPGDQVTVEVVEYLDELAAMNGVAVPSSLLVVDRRRKEGDSDDSETW